MTTPNKNGLQLLEQQTDTLQALLAINLPAGVDPRALVFQELDFLKQVSITKPEILNCIPETIEYGVKFALKNNLTLDPNAGLVYIKTRNINRGTQQAANWQKALEVQPTCNGLLSINYQCGKIIDHKNPVVKKDANGKVIEVEFEFLLSTGRWEKRTFDESDFHRWAIASHKENGRSKSDANIDKLNYANPNYTSWKGGVDPEFARAKAIRHSLKKLGTNANEKYATKIQLSPIKLIEVDPVKDAEAVGDGEYSTMEESSDGNNYHVETHEIVNVSDLNL
jgi:hypothetical protein